MRAVVAGAGVVGVTAAWYLAAAGHEVIVVDRQNGPALETSFANGGQVSVCHAEPWANPRAPAMVLRWIGREDSPLLWRMRADPAQWGWGLRFLLECLPGRTRANIEALVALGLYSRASLKHLRQSLSLEYDQQMRGILHVYTRAAEFDRAALRAAEMTALGCDRRVVDAAECIAVEPALARSQIALAGGTYTPDDESGDAHAFTEMLAHRCRERGVAFRFGARVSGLAGTSSRIDALQLADGTQVSGDLFVLALGSQTPLLLRGAGLRVRMPIYPAKGYSLTYALKGIGTAPVVSLTDDEHKLVVSRLGDRLRVAGTAEFCGYDDSINPGRIAAMKRRIGDLLPDCTQAVPAETWAGLRPATPGNVPMIGASGCPNLFLDCGHGTLGWTLACGSARLLADLIDGRAPDLDPRPYRVTG